MLRGKATLLRGAYRNGVLVYQYPVALTGERGVLVPGERFGAGRILGATIILLGVYRVCRC